ncbi:ParB/RepB/Spo0J family partition protein [Streptomyces sp. SPB4]|uniref:ParB/RepB/Spo0J family partition protein n=1 Tax=Streptomyces sp. SPB4 TaxID=2940553 RepID=UPI002475F2B3|nr:ParB/RepB/Spo0J family partition protein [Streptomyces sp. SPB4]MDH6544957.1 ParB family chromosome partitioning protein [Streptomyces sp. SPB4]
MSVKKAWADLIDGPAKSSLQAPGSAESAKPEAPPTTAYMNTIVGNPDNPRVSSDYTDDDAEFRDLKESMRAVGQLQPAAVVSSEVYRRVKPEHAAAIGDAKWVVILGNRRFHAAKQLGWTKFEIRVRDRLGNADDDKLDEAVIIENIQRKQIPPYKEAEFLQRMIERHGSQEKVAERIGKSQMYVSNRLTLLNLAPELRDVVDAKQLKVKTAEMIAKIKDPEKQKARAAEEIRKASLPRKRHSISTPASSALVQNPVLNQGSQVAGRETDTLLSGPDEAAPPQRVPEPRPEVQQSDGEPSGYAESNSVAPAWRTGAEAMDLVFRQLTASQRSDFILRYFQVSSGVDAVIGDMRGTLDTAARTQLAAILQQVAEGLLRE